MDGNVSRPAGLNGVQIGNRQDVGATLLLSPWTLWLLVALSSQCELGAFKRVAAALPERLRSHRWTRTLPIFSGEQPGNTGIGPVDQAHPRAAGNARRSADAAVSGLVIIFVLLGPVLALATDVTWRSYVMAWLIIHAIVTAAKFTGDKGVALVLSSVSLAGLLWLWLQGGGRTGSTCSGSGFRHSRAWPSLGRSTG